MVEDKMKTIKKPVKYQGISVPITLINEIKNYIENNDRYRSIGEFTREAIREKLNRTVSSQSNKVKEFEYGLNEINKKAEKLNEILESFDDESIEKLRKLSKIL